MATSHCQWLPPHPNAPLSFPMSLGDEVDVIILWDALLKQSPVWRQPCCPEPHSLPAAQGCECAPADNSRK